MRCKNCGSVLSKKSIDMNECEWCGAAIELEVKKAPTPEPAKAPQPMPTGNFFTKEVISKAKESCVRIETEAGTGSGFVTEGNLVVSNAHVITKLNEETNQMVVCSEIKAIPLIDNNKSYVLEVITFNVFEDVAIMRFAKEPKYIGQSMLGDTDEVEMGDKVCTIGNPLAWETSYTEGSVANPLVDRVGMRNVKTNKVLKLSLIIHGGNSGGPVFNTKGDVIGICTYVRIDEKMGGIYIPDPMTGKYVEAPFITAQHIDDMAYCVTAFTISQYLEIAKRKIRRG